MVEKKLIIDAIRFTYSGMFEMDEFFKEISDWQDENGYEREIKRKLQHVTAEGSNMEYTFELWKRLADFARSHVRMKALFRNIVDFELKRGELTRKMQKGHVLIIIDGFLETDVGHARWWQKPWYVFLRTLYEKYIWKFWWGKYDGVVANGCYSLYKRLHAYFKKYKY